MRCLCRKHKEKRASSLHRHKAPRGNTPLLGTPTLFERQRPCPKCSKPGRFHPCSTQQPQSDRGSLLNRNCWASLLFTLFHKRLQQAKALDCTRYILLLLPPCFSMSEKISFKFRVCCACRGHTQLWKDYLILS